MLLSATKPGFVWSADQVPRTQLTHPCSKVVTRSVRRQLEREVLRPAQAKKQANVWPVGCPLDPARDLWGRHEGKKEARRVGHSTDWVCGMCGKVFKSEHYLDLHMERKHMNETPVSGVCLADYCEVFEACQIDDRYRRRQDEWTCDNATMAKSRRQCEEAMARCFPIGQEVSRRMHAQFSKQLCLVLDCGIRAEQHKEHRSELAPVALMLVMILLVSLMVFSVTLCLVDCSDDILHLLVESKVASATFAKRVTKTREQTRRSLGMEGTKRV